MLDTGDTWQVRALKREKGSKEREKAMEIAKERVKEKRVKIGGY